MRTGTVMPCQKARLHIALYGYFLRLTRANSRGKRSVVRNANKSPACAPARRDRWRRGRRELRSRSDSNLSTRRGDIASMVTPKAMTAIRDPLVGFERRGKPAHRLDPFHRHHSILARLKRTIAVSVKAVKQLGALR
jgi:hypothetical protein